MKSFAGLSAEKQKHIINAALTCFGMTGYKKTSIYDIAEAASISKAMVFHYFGTKLEMYMYLANYVVQFMIAEYQNSLTQITTQQTDFFDQILCSTKLKVTLMKEHPAILQFVHTMFLEQDPDVRPFIDTLLSQGQALRQSFSLQHFDHHKFKANVDVHTMISMLTWMIEGYLHKAQANTPPELDQAMHVFTDSIFMMKQNFYKEEYV